ncbi:3-hydroxyacyl-[acyl-carrier-protein] dehydratase FabZ [Buchnera aphidicola (Eriosoma grossulariae)]|uniref:3-hydroxyacyl-ACP dehydratase FabZ n=1 Tax=Buchnera aphidicola TaxID=9 RepID=UPI0034648F58
MYENNIFDLDFIFNALHHRYPFLLVDRIIKFEKDNFIISIKNVTINEYYFQGHFPIKKIVPGILLIESIAQTAGIFLFQNNISQKCAKKYYLSSIHKAQFKKPVIPGDQMIIKVILDQFFKNFYKFNALIKVDNNIVCKSIITCTNF